VSVWNRNVCAIPCGFPFYVHVQVYGFG